ncbi:tartrate dehydrogenase [Planococcus shenhongbingii]|uniref:D-malate dehydrogenase (decarboxylating) n=1 Tax=Planococcus shenhongbingii TaxID=3058398 RepID=A0ABT8NAP9_9BACL|nr:MULTISPECIES: tartrate dehydrogenase [unclassified Planococcus (in: firmicutes)]MDN7244976.1 tartrate dehydrogenase [Planococcus sp. N017]WKA58076.1 tartrate dehydrogenase [Planococcus sp. N016]
MKTLDLAVIPGDGIGKEVVPEALRVLDAIAEIHGGLAFNYTHYPWSSEYYIEHGRMMPENGLELIKESDAIFLGAVGDPSLVPDHISLAGLLLKIRREFEQVINVRPAKQLRGMVSPLSNPKNFDILIIRENSEGEYSSIGGRVHSGMDEVVVQNAVFTKRGVSRVMEYGFEIARKRGGHLTSATKSNGIAHSMPFWDEVFQEMAAGYPDVKTNSEHIDALSAFFVTRPETLDVVVASNLFGDILSDLGAAIMGSIGIAPAGNINLNGKFPSMFEPVHGSAPDIYGRGIANPIGQIWTAKMMLDHLGEPELGEIILNAIETTLEAGIKTGDIGGKSNTVEVTDAIIAAMKKQAGK